MELPRVELDHLAELLKLMEQYDCAELELREEGKRLHLRRGKGASQQPQAVAVMPTMVAPGPAAPVSAEAGESGPEALAEDIRVITSPMVGTFYRAPSPNDAPFVEEGQTVEKDGTVLCIIEAMKVLNEIKSDWSGELVKILAVNGEAVEYGEPLFHVRVS